MNRDELLEKLAMEVSDWPVVKSCIQWDGDNFYPTDFMDRQPFSKEEWLAERERLINKPSWDEAPEKAQWLAQDPDGGWGFWVSKPDADDDDSTCEGWGGKETCAEYNQRELHKGEIPAGHAWRQTLEQRPDTLTTSLGASEWDEERIDIIGSNGNDGLAYSADAWSSEGLPPVGVPIEVKHKDATVEWANPDFHETTIVAMGKQLAIFTHPGSDRETVGRIDDYLFRPIRSEEDKAVEEMLPIIGNSHSGCYLEGEEIARDLYRAGYRKMEATHE